MIFIKLIKEFNVVQEPLGINELMIDVPEQTKNEVQEAIDKLPQVVKDLLPEVKLWIVWGTS